MDSKSLYQKKWFTTVEFQIREKTLFVSRTTPSGSVEEEFEFEEITTKVLNISKKDNLLMYLTYLGIVLSIFGLLKGSLVGFSIIALLSLASFFLAQLTITKSVHLYLNSGRYLVFMANKPDNFKVDEFIALLKLTIKNYMIKKYGSVDRDLPIENQLNNLIWLKNNGHLSEEEFSEKKDKLLKFKSDQKIGFV